MSVRAALSWISSFVSSEGTRLKTIHWIHLATVVCVCVIFTLNSVWIFCWVRLQWEELKEKVCVDFVVQPQREQKAQGQDDKAVVNQYGFLCVCMCVCFWMCVCVWRWGFTAESSVCVSSWRREDPTAWELCRMEVGRSGTEKRRRVWQKQVW